jgi:hypothetical protein
MKEMSQSVAPHVWELGFMTAHHLQCYKVIYRFRILVWWDTVALAKECTLFVCVCVVLDAFMFTEICCHFSGVTSCAVKL